MSIRDINKQFLDLYGKIYNVIDIREFDFLPQLSKILICFVVKSEREKDIFLNNSYERCCHEYLNFIKKNNDYAMWLKVCHKADCYLLQEPLAKYRRGRVGSISNHGYATLVKWHYKLFHEANGYNAFYSLWLTAWNIVFGVYKKLVYVKKYAV